jgi:Ca2+-binding RTX toxin-like protein
MTQSPAMDAVPTTGPNVWLSLEIKNNSATDYTAFAAIQNTDGSKIDTIEERADGSYGPDRSITSDEPVRWTFQVVGGGDDPTIQLDQSAVDAGFLSVRGLASTQFHPVDRDWWMQLTFDGSEVMLSATLTSSLTGGADAEALQGTRFHDELIGLRGADLLTGGLGDDTLRGGADDDLLKGGGGDDRIVGGLGDDTMRGGPGADTFVHGAEDGRDRIVDFEEGDRLVLRGYSVEGRGLAFDDLDSDDDGLLGAGDDRVSVGAGGNLVLHLSAFGGRGGDSVMLLHAPRPLDSADLAFA